MRFGLIIALLFLVSACGGGGGGSSAPAAPGSVATNDQASVDEEASVTIDVAGNDTAVDESTLSITSAPGNGTASVSDNRITYTPAADFSGGDSFSYSVTGDNGSTLTATVSVTVNDINDAPVAGADSFKIVEDNPLVLDLGANDTDIDGVISSFHVTGTFAGVISGSGTDLIYTPPLDFVGDVSFEYSAVDDDGAVSGVSLVLITVQAVALTSLEVMSLQIPVSGYATVNDAELGADVLASPTFEFLVPPNVVSVLVTLNGASANIDENGLFIRNLTPPSGPFVAFQRFVNFCFGGNCSSLVPRSPAYSAESGVWTVQLGTLANGLDDIDFDTLALTVVARTGPLPDLTQALPASITVRTFLTADSLAIADIERALARLVELGEANQVELVLEPVVVIEQSEFDSVSASFKDPETIALVSQGNPESVNLFFLEDFSGGEGIAGITGGVPGSFGTMNGNNGVLVNAGTLLADGSETSIDDVAEVAFHEMGHVLGLYHTTEARFSFIDVLNDTPFCEASVHDANNDGVANATECPDAANPMFWFNSVLIDAEELTDDQKYVLFYSPIAVPGR
ncbi:MAG: hypothetical protein ACI8Z1_003830 [Candidatus Azotimanducaceae bacterium]|jgi:hypothetical protein